jgi:HK97 family phage major capsid protein
VQRATGFIPYSIEVEQDYPGFAEQMAALLAAGYTDLIANATLNGSGSAPNPKGIFTSVAATSSILTATTTAGVLSAADVANVYGAQLERFRANSTWIMNVATEDNIRLFSTGGPGGTFSVDLQQPGIPKLFGKTVLRSDYAPKQPKKILMNLLNWLLCQ